MPFKGRFLNLNWPSIKGLIVVRYEIDSLIVNYGCSIKFLCFTVVECPVMVIRSMSWCGWKPKPNLQKFSVLVLPNVYRWNHYSMGHSGLRRESLLSCSSYNPINDLYCLSHTSLSSSHIRPHSTFTFLDWHTFTLTIHTQNRNIPSYVYQFFYNVHFKLIHQF